MPIHKKLRHILEGWQNFIDKPEVVEKVAIERAKICNDCQHKTKSKLMVFVKDKLKEIQGYKCNKCQCPLSSKLRSNDKCPINKW